jgi:hypothetical protein
MESVTVFDRALGYMNEMMIIKTLFNYISSFCKFVLDTGGDFFVEIIIGQSLIFPVFTLITLLFGYIQKDRIVNTKYYKLFKNGLIDLFECNFTKYFLLYSYFIHLYSYLLFFCVSLV